LDYKLVHVAKHDKTLEDQVAELKDTCEKQAQKLAGLEARADKNEQDIDSLKKVK